jgi:hypothetical protein
MRSLLPLVLTAAVVAEAGREAVYTAAKGDVSQTLVMKRVTASQVEFKLLSSNAKAACKDEVAGEASQNPLSHPGVKSTPGDFAAEEYVYKKGRCQLTFRVDMESATMVKVIAACPEHKKPKCPLELPAVLRIKR